MLDFINYTFIRDFVQVKQSKQYKHQSIIQKL